MVINPIDYPWLKHLWAQLRHLYQTQRMPQALLLVGVPGLGKRDLSQAWVQLLLCENPTTIACQQCQSCYWYLAQAHPDHWLADGSEIALDTIRDLHQFISQTSHQGHYRVITITQVERLSVACANALLKILEEPPAKTIWVLLAATVHKLLPTLASRCTKLLITPPTLSAGAHWLQTHYPQYTLAELENSLSLSGTPLKAIELLSSPLLQTWLQEFTLYFTQPQTTLPDYQPLLNNHALDALYLMYYWIARLAKQGPQPKLLDFLTAIMQAIESLQTPGINKQILFESLSYYWQHLKEQDYGTRPQYVR